jgi:hypothetical protein
MLETARARKRTIHELKIDNSLYDDPSVRRQVTLIWEAAYKDFSEVHFSPDDYGHATAYSKAKEAVSNLLRQLTREKKQRLFPTNEARK